MTIEDLSAQTIEQMRAEISGAGHSPSNVAPAVVVPEVPTPPPAGEEGVTPPEPPAIEHVDTNSGNGDEPVYKLSDLKKELGDFDSLNGLKQMMAQRELEIEDYKSRVSELDDMRKKVGEYRELEAYFENPYAHETIAKVDDFIRKTGIDDLALVSRFVGADMQEMQKKSPVEFLAFADLVDNPGWAKTMSWDAQVEAVAEQYGVSKEASIEEVSASMKKAVAKAAISIEEKIKPSDVKNKWVDIKEKRDIFAQQRTASMDAWTKTIDNFVWDESVEFSIPGDEKEQIPAHSVKVRVSDTTKAQVKAELKSVIQSTPNLSQSVSAEDIDRIKTYARSRAMQIESENAVKDAYYTAYRIIRAKAQEEAQKERHNGGEILRPEKSGVEQPNDAHLKKMREQLERPYVH